jgi:predicted nucleotidyltransferase
MHANAQILDEAVRRIVAVAAPKRIILFGSAARGEMTSHSDYDLLVVVPEERYKRRILESIYIKLIGVKAPVEVLLTTEEILERHKSDRYLIYINAVRDGKEIYAS